MSYPQVKQNNLLRKKKQKRGVDMQSEEKKNLEKEIIKITEQVIESVIKTSKSIDRKEEFGQNIELVSCLACKLSLYLDGQDDYVPIFLQQIIQQKMPDNRILTDFPQFSASLQKVIEEGIKKFHSKPEQKQTTFNETCSTNIALDSVEINTSENGEQTTVHPITKHIDQHLMNIKTDTNEIIVQPDELEIYLRSHFRDLTLLKNYKLHGVRLAYYLPELKLAVEKDKDRETNKSNVWKEYYCRKADIKLLKVQKEKLINYKAFSKFIKKHALKQETM